MSSFSLWLIHYEIVEVLDPHLVCYWRNKQLNQTETENYFELYLVLFGFLRFQCLLDNTIIRTIFHEILFFISENRFHLDQIIPSTLNKRKIILKFKNPKDLKEQIPHEFI